MLKLALIQSAPAWEDPARNIGIASEYLASCRGADVAVLPEMFSTGFSMGAYSVSGIQEGPGACSRLAAENSIALIAGTAARGDALPAGLNKALVYDASGALVAEYAKMHPFSFAGEDRHYAPGAGPVVFDLCGEPSSVFICYDLRFPEAFRSVARRVRIIYVLASWPAARQEHWVTLLRARAIENQCFVAGVNRVGRDGAGIAYAGGSCVFGPFGEVLMSAGPSEGVHMAELDIRRAESVRREYPFLNDMR